MKLFVGVLCALFIAALAEHALEPDFRAWMLQHEKVYAADSEYQYRFQVYLSSVEKVAELNNNNDGVTYALNKFADWTEEEFATLRGYKKMATEPAPVAENAPLVSAPSAYDWCSQGKCTPVKDQGQCGSCWAFATTENIESVWMIGGHSSVQLSPQQIVDCDTGEAGCNGGDPRQAYGYVHSAGGLDTSSYYPYNAVQGSCKFSSAHIGAKISGSKNTYGGSEDQMAANLASTAPFSILVDASSWQFYSGGILPASSCGQNLDHAVVAVGYSMGQYWRVRNSWGSSWGESGFIRLQFGKNTCGLQSEVMSSTL